MSSSTHTPPSPFRWGRDVPRTETRGDGASIPALLGTPPRALAVVASLPKSARSPRPSRPGARRRLRWTPVTRPGAPHPPRPSRPGARRRLRWTPVTSPAARHSPRPFAPERVDASGGRLSQDPERKTESGQACEPPQGRPKGASSPPSGMRQDQRTRLRVFARLPNPSRLQAARWRKRGGSRRLAQGGPPALAGVNASAWKCSAGSAQRATRSRRAASTIAGAPQA